MGTPKFVFTAFKHSFRVHIENLESLSVEKIQEIEKFVSNRNGIFDFNSYCFVIQKHLEFQEFFKLIKESGLNAQCLDNPLTVASKARVGFGQYKGMTYEELPDTYLLWLKTNYNGPDRDKIESELSKRRL